MLNKLQYEDPKVQERIDKLAYKQERHELQVVARLIAVEQEIECLQRTIRWFKKQIKPEDCGWMYTTIDGIKERIKVLRKEKKCLEK